MPKYVHLFFFVNLYKKEKNKLDRILTGIALNLRIKFQGSWHLKNTTYDSRIRFISLFIWIFFNFSHQHFICSPCIGIGFFYPLFLGISYIFIYFITNGIFFSVTNCSLLVYRDKTDFCILTLLNLVLVFFLNISLDFPRTWPCHPWVITVLVLLKNMHEFYLIF